MENVMIKINGVECSVPKGSTILEAARIAGVRRAVPFWKLLVLQVSASRPCAT